MASIGVIRRLTDLDILYVSLFEKIGLSRGSLIPYDDSYFQAFNEKTTHPWGYVELMVSVGNDIDL